MSLFIGLLLSLIGVLIVKYPSSLWFVTTGWRFRNAEPSELALNINKVIGYLLIIAGAGYILGFFFPGAVQ